MIQKHNLNEFLIWYVQSIFFKNQTQNAEKLLGTGDGSNKSIFNFDLSIQHLILLGYVNELPASYISCIGGRYIKSHSAISSKPYALHILSCSYHSSSLLVNCFI